MGAMSVSDSVRLALPAEAVDLARIQRRVWSQSDALASAVQATAADEATRAWHDAIVRPPLAHFRVLVAIGEAGIVGFAVTGPSGDPDAEATTGSIGEFIVDPAQRGKGHGSRLLNAAVDTLRTDGYLVATMWVPATDDALREFLVASGWGTDGAHQEVGVDDEGTHLKLVRLHTDIGLEPGQARSI
ncbi:Acetyltransferase (GNAT) domain-containing protein [Tessaracoccus bendigoensis DSM 12906]|uniref:Acetyltransferase (GNAT) domain-containing protein n=2 Tax=Tessaracoccus TaxID=72763 RepID=A0A1M6MSW3_9ACTN|nr:Acetyltransferase (GNAT) domain-containing protein [Tessaracoccus bendigoensis DSM 12906]